MTSEFLVPLIIILIASQLAGWLSHRLNLPSVFGILVVFRVWRSIRMGRRRVSVRIAGRARRSGDGGTRNGGSARVVRRSMISMRSEPALLRGGRSMTVGAVVRPGMSVGPA